MFQHFGNRLKRDLKQLVDRRLDASVTASGSLQKVPTFFLFFCRCYFLVFNINLQSSGVEVDVISHKRQRFALLYVQPIPNLK